MAIITIKDEDFDRFVLGNKKLVLVEFFDPDKMLCRALNPILSELSEDLAGLLVITKVRTEDPALYESYGLESIPTLMLFSEGNKLDGIVGLRNKQQIFDMIKKHL